MGSGVLQQGWDNCAGGPAHSLAQAGRRVPSARPGPWLTRDAARAGSPRAERLTVLTDPDALRRNALCCGA